MLVTAGMVLGACSRDRLDEPDAAFGATTTTEDPSAGDSERVGSEELSDVEPVPVPTTEAPEPGGPAPEATILTTPTTTAPPAGSRLTVELVLDEVRVEDTADLWPAQHDEVAIGVIATDATGASRTSVVDVGKLEAGEEVEPQLTLATFATEVPSDAEQIVDVQLIAIELDSDGFDGVVDELERVARSLTGGSDPQSRPRLSSESLDALTRDDGLLVNDHDLIGACWVRAALAPGADEMVTSAGVTRGCVAEDTHPSALLFFNGEGGAWGAEVTWLVTDRSPLPQPAPTTAPPTTAPPTTRAPTTTTPPPAPPTTADTGRA
ncbi:MAG: hypothetical protein S0880_29245 [Actinomycetota bacterium]|nr:hypothetical protein [Actinomycetota bacterium]